MAEGFEPYHVPQQSRRDKLRLVAQTHQGFLPYYDASALSSSDLNSFLNPNTDGGTIQGFNTNETNPFLYTPQNIQSLRDFTQSYNSGDLVAFKPEPLNNHESSANNSSQCLSLSLSSHYNNQNNLFASYASTSNDVSRSSVPLGPFTGYASVLMGSRFLKPAQLLLEEFCNNGRGVPVEENSSLMEDHHEMDGFSTCEIAEKFTSSGDCTEQRRKKSTLLTLLEEVYRRYKQYNQQIQAAVTSFEYVAGLGNAAPYAHLALQTLSKHFRSLKNAITDQIQFTNKAHTQSMSHGKDGGSRFGNTDRDIYCHQRFPDHQPVWRPQRGLPEPAVTVLRAWLFEHFLHPYPTDTDKLMLAKQTGLSRNQVSNWFINARVRLWKPMVEEIHMLETRQTQKSTQREDQNADAQNEDLPTGQSFPSEIPSTSDHRTPETSKRTRSELPDLPANLSYSNMSSHQHGGGSMNTVGVGSVSLTLGLHQNNGIGLSEPFPVNAAQRYGINLDSNGDHGFDIGGFEAQNRHFQGQLLHDFVG